MLAGCREARRAALQASLAEKQAAEKAGHNYKANPVPPHIHNPSMTPLPEPSFTVSVFILWLLHCGLAASSAHATCCAYQKYY